MAGIGRATGTRPVTCPWRGIDNPFVQNVLRAHRWFKEGQLEAIYPNGIPEAIRRGIEVYESAINAIQVADIREDRENRKRDAKEDRKSLVRRKG